MTSRSQGSYLALLTELTNHGLPELQRLEQKLAQGETLNNSELEHVAHWVQQTQTLASLEQQIGEKANGQASKQLTVLLHSISQQALKNVK